MSGELVKQSSGYVCEVFLEKSRVWTSKLSEDELPPTWVSTIQ